MFDKVKKKGKMKMEQTALFTIIEKMGITISQLAKEIGISQGNISDWKSGKCLPSLNALIKIADYLNVSLDYLVGRTETSDNSEENDVKFSRDIFSEFKKFCLEKEYEYKITSFTTDYVTCRVCSKSIVEYFEACIKSEREETVKMLCSLPKPLLTSCELDHYSPERWVYQVDVEILREALERYDEPEFVEERRKMMETL